jgi:hypothetical protein
MPMREKSIRNPLKIDCFSPVMAVMILWRSLSAVHGDKAKRPPSPSLDNLVTGGAEHIVDLVSGASRSSRFPISPSVIRVPARPII